MNLTTNQITALARKKILEATNEVVDDATILIYANLTQDDIIKRAFPNDAIATAAITFTNGVGTLPTDFGTLYGDAYRNTSDFFPELSIEDFNRKNLSQSVTIESGTIKVYPTTVGSLSVKYYKTFPALTSAVNPSFNSYFHELIIYGILARAYEDLQDQDLASLNDGIFEKKLSQKIATQSQYEEGNQRAGQMFNAQDLLGGGLSKSDPNYF